MEEIGSYVYIEDQGFRLLVYEILRLFTRYTREKDGISYTRGGNP